MDQLLSTRPSSAPSTRRRQPPSSTPPNTYSSPNPKYSQPYAPLEHNASPAPKTLWLGHTPNKRVKVGVLTMDKVRAPPLSHCSRIAHLTSPPLDAPDGHD
jgi:hypothetical protein